MIPPIGWRMISPIFFSPITPIDLSSQKIGLALIAPVAF
jgi:hypothetical protein